jgi:hypothetical protein
MNMADNQIDLDQTLTANQLFKKYKDEGGTLNFSEWLTREKTKGVFPLNDGLNQEINLTGLEAGLYYLKIHLLKILQVFLY